MEISFFSGFFRILGFRMLVILLEFIVPDEFFTMYK